MSDHPGFPRSSDGGLIENVISFPGTSQPMVYGGGGGGEGMEVRIARLEANVEHIQSDVTEVKLRLGKVEDRLGSVDSKVSEISGKISNLPGWPGMLAIAGLTMTIIIAATGFMLRNLPLGQ